MHRLMKILFAFVMITACIAGQPRTADLEEAWREGQFSGVSLRNVTCLMKGQTQLTEEQKECLAASKILTKLTDLDLSGQDITDDFVKNLCGNPIFRGLKRIDLSDNPEISELSLQNICNSKVGSVRDLPQTSERYGKPSSEIHVRVSGTRITSEIAQKYNAKPQVYPFVIFYFHPFSGKQTSPHAYDAIKWVQVEL